MLVLAAAASVAVSAVALTSSVPAVPGIPAAPAAPAMPSKSAAAPAAPTTFVVLQMNLCNSGMALSCYTHGKAVDEAVEKIRRYAPELVTLQEVCRDDLYAGDGWGKLAQAMADLYGTENVTVHFVPARHRLTNEPYRCLNGELFGNALMHNDDGDDVYDGRYANQDPSPEARVWACATVIPGQLTGCTTHLSTSPDMALRQCRELMSILASDWVQPRVVVAGDLNLLSQPGKPYDIEDCMPASYDRRSDNAVQHLLFTRSLERVRGGYEAMRWTDHPLLHQTFRVTR